MEKLFYILISICIYIILVMYSYTNILPTLEGGFYVFRDFLWISTVLLIITGIVVIYLDLRKK